MDRLIGISAMSPVWREAHQVTTDDDNAKVLYRGEQYLVSRLITVVQSNYDLRTVTRLGGGSRI